MKSYTVPNQPNTVDVLTLAFVFWLKFALLKMLCRKMHCYDAKSTCYKF